MKKYSGVKVGIILAVLVLLLVGYYYYLSNRLKEPKESNEKLTKVQEVLLRDMEWDYPPTPKEVVKYYSEITKCFYNETYSDDELEKLARKAMALFDEELISYNPWITYSNDLKEDIKEYKEKKITILAYTTSSSTDVDFFEDDGSEWARLRCTYTLKQNTKTQKTNEIFLLRKDSDGRWKIYGWDLQENVAIQEEE